MDRRIVRYIIYGQACFYAGLLICAFILPQGLTVNGGISYYGVHHETILPYVLTLLGPAYFTIRIAQLYKEPSQKLVRYALTAFGLLTIGVMLTPDMNAFMDGIHRAFGIPLFSLQLLFSVWLIVQLKYKFLAILFTAMELTGGVLALIWLTPGHGWELESQILFQTGLGGLLLYGLPRLPSPNKNVDS